MPEFFPGLNTHVHTCADTIHVPYYTHKRTQSQVCKSLHWSQCTPPPRSCVPPSYSCVSAHSGPSRVFLQPLLPALSVPHPPQGSVPASVVPLVNGIVMGGTCLMWSWEAGVFDTGNEVSSGLASGKCPQCSLPWEASHTAAHGTNCPLVLDFHILESPFISLRL